MNQRPHISPSQLTMYARCPEQYRRRYLEAEIIPPGISLLKGTGFHGGAKTNMDQKIETHQDLPAKDIVESAVSSFEAAAAGGYVLSEDEAPDSLGKAKDGLVTMAECHAKDQAPEYQPVIVERKIRIGLPGTRDLLGIIDLADDQGRVVDFKTASRRKNRQEADASVQLTTYAAAYHAERGEPPASLRLDSVVQTSAGKTYRDLVETRRTELDLEALANRINAVTTAIDAGSFPPTDPSNWWCSKKFCGYYSTCPFVNPRGRNGAQGD